MTDQDAYRRYTTEAEKLLKLAETPTIVTLPDTATEAEASTFLTQVKAKFQREDIVMMSNRSELNTPLIVATAAVWATLALAAAQERVQPADRPTDGPTHLPNRVKDGDGDEWELQPDTGTYTTPGSSYPQTLRAIARDYRGYVEIP